jgi:hypothetical protein
MRTSPRRIHLRRVKGWRLPLGKVADASRLTNPHGPAEHCAPANAEAVARCRLADLLCERCAVRCEQRWPTVGDFYNLHDACAARRDCTRRVDHEGGRQFYPLPDLTPIEFDHLTVTHEAGHAVVAILGGLPLLAATIGEATVDTSVSGRVLIDAYTGLLVRNHLAMLWAGQQAGLRWLRDHGYDTRANRIDERYLSRSDTADADRYIRRYDLEDCAGQDLADHLLSAHWAAVTAVATALHSARRLDGATVRRIVAATKPEGGPVTDRDALVLDQATVRHGYTLADLHRLAAIAARIPAATWLDGRDAYDAAWHGLVEALLLAEQRPARGYLLNEGRQAVSRLVKDECHHHGVPVDRPWAGRGAMPQFARYWWSGSWPDPAPEIVDRLALAAIWPKLSACQQEALAALAATDDYRDAAAMLGIAQGAFRERVISARRVFLRWWHQFETPSGQYRPDKRHGMFLRHGTGPDTCRRGHPWDEANTRWRPGDGQRQCRACERASQARRAAGVEGVAA